MPKEVCLIEVSMKAAIANFRETSVDIIHNSASIRLICAMFVHVLSSISNFCCCVNLKAPLRRTGWWALRVVRQHGYQPIFAFSDIVLAHLAVPRFSIPAYLDPAN